jgi:hypothetical protein
MKQNKPSDKNIIIKELENFKEAFQRLGFAWSDYNLDNKEGMKHYPFHNNRSVMIRKVEKWVDEIIKEIEAE